jgi:hypothetical protein
MAWEIVHKGGSGGKPKGEAWNSVPAIAFNKTGITMNRPFCDVFGVKKGTYIMRCADRSRRVIGLKVVPDGDSLMDACKVDYATNGKGTGTQCMSISGNHLAKLFPDCIGRIYRAHLNPGERIIEISLAPNNTIE